MRGRRGHRRLPGTPAVSGRGPDVFGFDEDADVVVVLDEHSGRVAARRRGHAVKYCPAFALSIEEESTDD